MREREGIASMWQPVFPLVTVVDRDELDLIMETWKESRRDEREEERKEEISRARLGVFNPFSKGLERRRSEEVFHGLRRTEKGITQSFPKFTLSSFFDSFHQRIVQRAIHGWYSIPLLLPSLRMSPIFFFLGVAPSCKCDTMTRPFHLYRQDAPWHELINLTLCVVITVTDR